MIKELNLKLYQGNGVPIDKREQVVPDYETLEDFRHPKNYIAAEGLRNAVNVALALGQPLLVTGEPGTGKTQLADSIAWELGLPLLEFHTKTTSTAADLFYRYDALLRFQDTQVKEKKRLNINDYITYEALGKAILLTKPPKEVSQYLPEDEVKEYLPGNRQWTDPMRSVVLIDEIDKAPRDLPNDVLNEIERMQFTVKETGVTFKAEKRLRPILVLTSNSEKNLPDAFLRRCVFYHIPFPQKHQLKEIVQKRFGKQAGFTPEFVDTAIDRFLEIRKCALKKKPATAEFLGWLPILQSLEIDDKTLKKGQAEAIILSFSILAKDRKDFALLKSKFTADKHD